MMFTFLVCLAGVALLWVTLVKLELLGKQTSGQVSKLRRALEAEGFGGNAEAAGTVGRRIAPNLEAR